MFFRFVLSVILVLFWTFVISEAVFAKDYDGLFVGGMFMSIPTAAALRIIFSGRK